jgi:RHS repeat-associated protein
VRLAWLSRLLALTLLCVLALACAQEPHVLASKRISKAELTPKSTHELTNVSEGAQVVVRLAWTGRGHQAKDAAWSYRLKYKVGGQEHALSVRSKDGDKPALHEAARIYVADDDDFEIRILAVESSGTAPDNLHAELEELPTQTAPGADTPSLSAPSDLVVHPTGHVTWRATANATAYEVQWTFVDADDEALADAFFKRPTGTIEAQQPEAQLELGYGGGEVHVRVRALGTFPGSDTLHRGPWRVAPSLDLASVKLNEDRNWFRTTRFDNQGTSRTTLQHYDALLRERQQLETSRTSTRGQEGKRGARVMETVLDDEGRAALTTLPIPVLVEDAPSGLAFRPGFTKSAGSNETLSSRQLRTGESPNGTTVDKPPELAESGAGAFFKKRQLSELAEGVEERWLPIEPRPYTSTVFARDLRGRPARSNGVGTALHDHPSTFLSGSAGVEFRQLFGNTAGLLANYTRDISIDPNEQGHVRYTDPEGKLVAVGLVGKAPTVGTDPSAPEILSPLEDNPLPGGPTLQSRIEIPPTKLEPEQKTHEYVHTLVNGASTDYTFNYRLDPTTEAVPLATEPPRSVCPTCKYTAEIWVQDPFGAVEPCGTVTRGICTDGKYTVTVGQRETCSPTAGDITFEVTLPEAGEYRVIRRVTLDDRAVEEFVQDHEAQIPGVPARDDVERHVDSDSANPCALSECTDDACAERLIREAARNECEGLEATARWERQQTLAAACEQQRTANPDVACDSDVAAAAQYVCPQNLCPVAGASSACCHARRCWAVLDTSIQSKLFETRLARTSSWQEANARGLLDSVLMGAARPPGINVCNGGTCRDPIFFTQLTAALRARMQQGLREYKPDPCDESAKINLWDYVNLSVFGFDDATKWMVFRGAYQALRTELLTGFINQRPPGCSPSASPSCCGNGRWCPYNDVVKAPDLTLLNATGEEIEAAATAALAEHCNEQCTANVCNWRWQLADGLCPAYQPFPAESPAYVCDAETPTDEVHHHLLNYCLNRCNNAFDPTGSFSASALASHPDLIAAANAAKAWGDGTGQACDFGVLASPLMEPELVCEQQCEITPELTVCGRLLVWYLRHRGLDPEELSRELKRRSQDCPRLEKLTDEKKHLAVGECRVWLVDETGRQLSLDAGTGEVSTVNAPPETMPVELRSKLTGIVIATPDARRAYVLSDCPLELTRSSGRCCGGRSASVPWLGLPPEPEPTEEQVCAAPELYSLPPIDAVMDAAQRPDRYFACTQGKPLPATAEPQGTCSREYLERLAAILSGQSTDASGECAGAASVQGRLISVASAEAKTCWFELFSGEKPSPWLETSGFRITAVENAALPPGYPETREHRTGGTEFALVYSGVRLVLTGSNGQQVTVYVYGTRHCGIHLGPACKPVGGGFKLNLPPFEFSGWEDTCKAQAEEFEKEQIDRLVTEGTEDAKHAWTSTVYAHCMGGDLGETFTVSYQAAEYAHTIFYYDQVGNLTTIVPPKGVSKVDPSNENATPAHMMLTRVEYDARNNITKRKSPDAGDATFIYDSRGRRRFAQTSEQAPRQEWSYAEYDTLDRVVETGLTGPYSVAQIRSFVDTNVPNGARRDERVASRYGPGDEPGGLVATDYTRGRVREVSASSSETKLTYAYGTAGQIRSFKTEHPALGTKTARYEHDPVDDALLSVAYQAGESVDELHQRYEYDSERRLKLAESSTDGVNWEKDARYEFYAHLPLRRAVLGEDEVQGLDYIHTIHGWPKAVNAGDASASKDPGGDGKASGAHAAGRQDLVGLVFSYFEGDFASADMAFLSGDTGTEQVFARDGPGLYTGIIRNRVLTNRAMAATSAPARARYDYDQLTRLTKSAITTVSSGQEIPPALLPGSTRYAYDRNGNLTEVERWGDADGVCPGKFDDLRYTYEASSNRLLHIDDDTVANTACDSDIDDQGIFQAADTNYGYDAVGRLVRDRAEGITSVAWSGTDKVLSVGKSGVSEIAFAYDGLDRRISKTAGETKTLYVRHPDGRILATYKITGTETVPQLEEHVLYAGTKRIGTRLPHTPSEEAVFEVARGNSRYELVDQVGSVLAVVSGDSEVASAADYYPFGMLRPGRERSFAAGTRFGFGGYEKDDELKSLGASYVTDARFYDSRVGRWLSPDPLFASNPENCVKSPADCALYTYALNDPINITDPTGTVGEGAATKGLRWLSNKTWKMSSHIYRRHMALDLFVEKSKFLDPRKVRDQVRTVLRNVDGARVTQQNGRILFEREFRDEIGTSGEKIMRVVVDEATGRVITAFPAKGFKVLGGTAAAIVSSYASNAEAAVGYRSESVGPSSFVDAIIDVLVDPTPAMAGEQAALRRLDLSREAVAEATLAVEHELNMSVDGSVREEIEQDVSIQLMPTGE